MSISTEEKDRYLRETAIVLAREGFQTGKTDTGKLRVLLDGAPLCEVTENGGITYRNEDINEPERVAAKDMVYEIVRNTAEYMRQMETAPFLKADGLEDGYKVLADFNGTVLAGVQSKHGVHFVTWDWAYGHTGVCHGHYFMENYVVIDCSSYIANDILSAVALMEADSVLQLASCDLKSVGYLSSQLPLLGELKWDKDKQYRVASNIKPFQAADRIGQVLGSVVFRLPYSQELEEQYLAGELLADLSMKDSRAFRKEINRICKEVF